MGFGSILSFSTRYFQSRSWCTEAGLQIRLIQVRCVRCRWTDVVVLHGNRDVLLAGEQKKSPGVREKTRAPCGPLNGSNKPLYSSSSFKCAAAITFCCSFGGMIS